MLRRLAQGIVVERGQEIAVMIRALADRPAAASAPAPTHHHDTATGYLVVAGKPGALGGVVQRREMR